jgi:hypothetical protein
MGLVAANSSFRDTLKFNHHYAAPLKFRSLLNSYIWDRVAQDHATNEGVWESNMIWTKADSEYIQKMLLATFQGAPPAPVEPQFPSRLGDPGQEQGSEFHLTVANAGKLAANIKLPDIERPNGQLAKRVLGSSSAPDAVGNDGSYYFLTKNPDLTAKNRDGSLKTIKVEGIEYGLRAATERETAEIKAEEARQQTRRQSRSGWDKRAQRDLRQIT